MILRIIRRNVLPQAILPARLMQHIFMTARAAASRKFPTRRRPFSSIMAEEHLLRNIQRRWPRRSKSAIWQTTTSAAQEWSQTKRRGNFAKRFCCIRRRNSDTAENARPRLQPAGNSARLRGLRARRRIGFGVCTGEILQPDARAIYERRSADGKSRKEIRWLQVGKKEIRWREVRRNEIHGRSIATVRECEMWDATSASIRNPQTFNRYSYVLNSPYKFTDPLGLLPGKKGVADGGRAWCSTCKTTDEDPWFAEPITFTLVYSQEYTEQGIAENQDTEGGQQQQAEEPEPPHHRRIGHTLPGINLKIFRELINNLLQYLQIQELYSGQVL